MAEISAATFASMISHMNDDHGDAVIAYARHYGGLRTVGSARIVAMDAHACTVEATTEAETLVVSIPFDHELVDGDDGRNTLIAMYMTASGKGESR
jgi:putative heme iron utilization protein